MRTSQQQAAALASGQHQQGSGWLSQSDPKQSSEETREAAKGAVSKHYYSIYFSNRRQQLARSHGRSYGSGAAAVE